MGEDFPVPGGFGAGPLVAGYRIESRIGAGGMAVVFRARDERLGRLVALKVLAPQWAGDEEFRRRFVAESRAAAAVDDPHIIPVHEAGEADGVLFIAMRLVAGSDLRGVLRREGVLPPGRALGLLSPVAAALDAAHAAGLVHRDVKSANILVDERPGRPDHVYLSDFGLSKSALAGVSLTTPGQYLGTPHYSAPEQVQGHRVDGRADQYALACVACELLTGQPPFERDQPVAVLLAHLSEPPPSLAGRRPGLPPAADLVLARALAKTPEQRYPSCRDFTDALRAALGLPPYGSPGTAASGRPTAGNLVVSMPAATAGAGTAVGLADRGGASGTLDAGVPAMARALTQPGDAARRADRLSPGPGTPSDLDRPSGPAGALAAGRGARSGLDPVGGEARPARRPFLVIALAGAVIAAAVAVPLVLAMPGMRGASSSSTATRTPATTRASDVPSSGARTRAATPPWSGPLAGTLTAALLSGSPGSVVTSVAFGPGATTLAVGDENGRVYLWDTATRTTTAILSDPGSSGVTSVAFGPGGTTLAVGDDNSSVYLWDTATKTTTAILSDPGGRAVSSVAFGPGAPPWPSATRTAGSTCGTPRPGRPLPFFLTPAAAG